MKVYRRRKRWSDDYQPWHLIEKSGSRKGDAKKVEKLAVIFFTAYCDEVINYRNGDEYEQFDKTKHTKKTVCEGCVKIYMLLKRSHVKGSTK